MYGLWILLIIFAVLLVISIVLLVVGNIHLIDGLSYGGGFMTVIIGVVLFVLILIIPRNLNSSKREYNEFLETKTIVEQLVTQGTDLENAGITSQIIEANKWLASAKASKKTYKNWSRYYYINLNNIEPIQLR